MYKYKNEILTEQDLGLWSGPLPTYVEDVKDRPLIHWTGKPIPRNLLSQMKSFLLWTQNKFGGESQIRLYYNEKLDHWKAIVLPQEISHGLSTREVAGHKWRQRAFDTVPATEGWAPNGTIHHHCTAGAFQSGTDVDDEKDQHGLHITFGHLDKDAWSFDARVTFNKLFYDVDTAEWFEGDMDEVCKAPHAKETCPRMWKRHMVKKVVVKTTPVVRQNGSYQRYNHSSGFHSGNRSGYHSGNRSGYHSSNYKMPSVYVDEWWDACNWPTSPRSMLMCNYDIDADLIARRAQGMIVAASLASALDEAGLFTKTDRAHLAETVLEHLKHVVDIMVRLPRSDWGDVATAEYSYLNKTRAVLANLDIADQFDELVGDAITDPKEYDDMVETMFPLDKEADANTATVSTGTCGEDDQMYYGWD